MDDVFNAISFLKVGVGLNKLVYGGGHLDFLVFKVLFLANKLHRYRIEK
jgi:hypothetical protein